MKNATIGSITLAVTMGGFDYEFENVTVVNRNDPLAKSLQASPQNRGKGLVVTTGLSSGVALEYTLFQVPTKTMDLLDEHFKNDERVVVKLLDKKAGESVQAKHALISSSPRNGSIQEGADSNMVNLNLEVTRNNIKDKSI